MTAFSGSYSPEEVTFLLKVIELAPLDIESRERLIQSGQSHYSEMIGPEAPPDPRYLTIFFDSLERSLGRLARDCLGLAAQIASSRPGPVTLVSLARSGTPVGVILGKIIREHFKKEVCHYSISVIRDRGVDQNAIRHILARHEESSVVFIDGWTGKGVIARELKKTIKDFNQSQGTSLDGTLAVLSDLAGVAGMAMGADDWLIPSCLLNSVVAGLISRTILNDRLIGPDDFHGCLYYRNLADCDLSRYFVERVLERAAAEIASEPKVLTSEPLKENERNRAAQAAVSFLDWAKNEFGVEDENLIKPGLGESTRVLLRRSPELLLVRNLTDPEVRHALLLAEQRGILVREDRNL
ncbi:MAG: cysteine protease StiP family protein, partial [Deltaproteobacteria bacterium]|nr:cysteine protease StiP family protein [Deltaproteobacteria bacterium]